MSTEAPPAPQSPQPPPRRSRLVVPLLLVLAFAGWGVALYRSDALPKRARPVAAVVFHVRRTPPTLLGPAAHDPGEFESFRAEQAALIRRRLTLNAAINQPEVKKLELVRRQPDPLGWLEGALRVTPEGPEFLRVELDGDPEEAKTILQALAKQYLQEADERGNGARRDRLATLENQNKEYLSRIDAAYKRIDTIALALGCKDGQFLALKDAMLRDEYREAMRELRAVRDELRLAELVEGAAAEAPGIAPWVAAPVRGEQPKGREQQRLQARWALAKARVGEIEQAIAKAGQYRRELDKHKEEIRLTEKMSETLTEAVERIKLELRAPARVTLAEEPHELGAPRAR